MRRKNVPTPDVNAGDIVTDPSGRVLKVTDNRSATMNWGGSSQPVHRVDGVDPTSGQNVHYTTAAQTRWTKWTSS